MNDIAAITCFSNLENNSDKVDTFIEFKNKLKDQGVPLFTMEVVPEGKIPDLSKICEKGYFEESAIQNLHKRINQALSEIGAHIDLFEYCPHHIEAKKAKYLLD